MLISANVAAESLFYGGLEWGGAFPTGNAVMDGAGNSYAVALGMQPSKYFGLEVGAGSSDWKIYSDTGYRTVIANSSLKRAVVTAIGYWPISEYFSVFGSVGVANNLYSLSDCKNCASDQVSTSSKSVVHGLGLALGTKNEKFPIVRLGYERYALNTQLISELSVDHVYLQMMLGF